MNRSPSSFLHQLLGASIMVALSVWLITWAVNAILPLIPFLSAAAVLAGAVWIGAGIIKRRRYW